MERLDQLASKVFAILGEAGIPAEIIGGYALSHYGYVRNTLDIDIIVRDHVAAVETLKAHGFIEAKHWFMLQDPSLPGVKVDVLPGGRTIGGNTQSNPMPSDVSVVPVYITLFELIQLKLGVVVYNGGQVHVQKKNSSDVDYLIVNNKLPRDFMSSSGDETIRFEYEESWDLLHQKRSHVVDPFADFFDAGDE